MHASTAWLYISEKIINQFYTCFTQYYLHGLEALSYTIYGLNLLSLFLYDLMIYISILYYDL